MSLVVGLTGGIGCGKSMASKLFSELGIKIIDTDLIAQQFTGSDGLAIDLIREKFGQDFINADGALNRNKMRALVFSDNDARLKLEKILHPLILKETQLQIEQAHSPYIIVVIPLLFEKNDFHHLIQRTLVIDCDEQQQLIRTMTRSQLSEQQVSAIMATQVSRQTRLRNADDIIINDQDINYLKSQVLQLHHKYLSLLQTSGIEN